MNAWTYVGPTSSYNLITMFIFIYTLPWDFLPFILYVLLHLRLLSGWLSPSLFLPHSFLNSAYISPPIQGPAAIPAYHFAA